MRLRIEIRNTAQLDAALSKLGANTRGAALVRALNAGANVVLNDAKRRVPVDTGTLRRSLHVETVTSGGTSAEVAVGTDVVYAARIEFGFFGPDALGRNYHQPAHPYLRPALEERRGEVEQTTIRALKTLVGV